MGKDSERMANSKDPDQTASYDKMIASMCFNFMSKMFGIALLFFQSELWIKKFRSNCVLRHQWNVLKCSYFFRKHMDKTLSFIFHLFSFFLLL